MFTEEHGDRLRIPNIGFVVTDGVSNRDQNLTIPEADMAREKGAHTLLSIYTRQHCIF